MVENSFVIFCVATYGEGDPTDNAQDFHEWLKERSDSLKGLRYAVSHPNNLIYNICKTNLISFSDEVITVRYINLCIVHSDMSINDPSLLPNYFTSFLFSCHGLIPAVLHGLIPNSMNAVVSFP